MKYSDLPTDLNVHPITNDLFKVEGNSAILNQIKNLVYINFYEMPYQNELGCGIWRALFENFNEFTRIIHENNIRSHLMNHVTRAKINAVKLRMDIHNHLICSVFFTPNDDLEIISVDIRLKRER